MHSPGSAAEVLEENTHLLPSTGSALDVACGAGGNALLLATHRLEVDAVDISEVALQKLSGFAQTRGLHITTQCLDLEAVSLPPKRYDIVVCSHYLYRPLCASLVDRLNPGGLLFYQTFIANKLDKQGRGPRSQAFLLQNNELLSLFRELQLVYFREDDRIGDLSRGSRNTAGFIGLKTGA